MFTVYVLQGADGKLYKGATSDFERRLSEHRAGYTRTTSRMKDIRVIYSEHYASWEEARKREKYLKSAAGRRFLKNIGPVA